MITRAERRRQRTEALRRGEVEVEHGLYSTYINWGCRCWKCVTANWVVCTIRGDRRAQAK